MSQPTIVNGIIWENLGFNTISPKMGRGGGSSWVMEARTWLPAKIFSCGGSGSHKSKAQVMQCPHREKGRVLGRWVSCFPAAIKVVMLSHGTAGPETLHFLLVWDRSRSITTQPHCLFSTQLPASVSHCLNPIEARPHGRLRNSLLYVQPPGCTK